MQNTAFSRTKIASRIVGVLALGWLAVSNPAQATALTFQNYVQGSQGISFANSSPAASGYFGAGEMLFGMNDGGVTSVLRAYCVDIFQYASSSAQNYTLASGLSHFGAERASDLGRLFTTFDAWNGSTSITAQETAALQIAVWEIVNETARSASNLQLNLSSGNFKITAAATGTVALAQGWLNSLPTANNWYQVSAYESASYQDYLVLNKVPEPGSLALVLGALGSMGLVARRRKAKAQAV
nr:PEP-CTERM sorting domain-containing protein [uncultured Albidiferax sp.]